MSGIHPSPSKRTRIDAAILAAYSQPVFERVARRYAFGAKGWMLQNIVGMAIAILLLVGGFAIIGVAAKQSWLDAYGTRTTGVIKNVSFRTDTVGRKTRWETLVYQFTTQQDATIEARLDRPVQELSGLPRHGSLVVAYWERFPGINAPRGVERGGVGLVGIGLLFLLGSCHFICFVRRGIRWRRSLLAASAVTGPDQPGQLPHVVEDDVRTRGA